MSKGQYLYATGRIRSLENKLLDANDIERMIDAKDAQTAYKVFNDLSYADELADIDDSKDYIEVLDHDLMQVKKVLMQITPDERLLKLLFLIYDFHNIKLLFKAKFLEKDLSKYESQLGNINIASLKDAILKDVKTSIPDDVLSIICDANKIFEKENNGFIIDSYLDTQYFELIKDIVKKINNKFINNLVKTWIDIGNVKIFLRAKKLGLEIDKIKGYISEGGNILKTSLINYYQKDLKEAVTICSRGFEDAEIKEEIKNYSEGGDLWKLEKSFEDYEMKFISEAKYIAYGPEIVLAYYLAKKNAVKNIRLVFTGKLNELKSAEIKERLRKLY